MAIHINKLYIHTAVVTHICIYNSEPCTNVHAPKQKIYWYLVYKPIQTAILYQHIYIVYVLTTGTVDHEQAWQPYAVDPYNSAISKWWPYLLALYINTDNQQ